VLTAGAAAGATLEPRATMENLLKGAFTKLRQRREITRQKTLMSAGMSLRCLTEKRRIAKGEYRFLESG
jgi:hypothetical protein